MNEIEKLYQIKSSYYCAGLITRYGIIKNTAPILKWMKGKDIKFVEKYCKSKNFKLIEVR